MNTELVKSRGKRRYFSQAVEDRISRLYYNGDSTAAELAEEYAKLAPKGTLSASAVRLIAKRSAKRRGDSIHGGVQGAEPGPTGQPI